MWTTTIIQDRWAYASYLDCTVRRRFAYRELKDFPYHQDAMRAAVDDVLDQLAAA